MAGRFQQISRRSWHTDRAAQGSSSDLRRPKADWHALGVPTHATRLQTSAKRVYIAHQHATWLHITRSPPTQPRKASRTAKKKTLPTHQPHPFVPSRSPLLQRANQQVGWLRRRMVHQAGRRPQPLRLPPHIHAPVGSQGQQPGMQLSRSWGGRRRVRQEGAVD